MVFAVYRLKTKEKNILNRSQISILYNRYIVFRFSQYPGCKKQNENSVYRQLYRIRCFDPLENSETHFFPQFLSTFQGYIAGVIFMYLYLLDRRVETFLDSFWHTDDAKKLFSLKSHTFHNTVMQMGFDGVFVRNRASPYFVPCFMFDPPLPRVFLCPMYRQRRWRERSWRKNMNIWWYE